ncbi:MAG: hypothetical protein R2695_09435 [Acidimicrobiales bacterium]
MSTKRSGWRVAAVTAAGWLVATRPIPTRLRSIAASVSAITAPWPSSGAAVAGMSRYM